jgi:glycerophosphoryl diester phosphodiesterase
MKTRSIILLIVISVMLPATSNAQAWLLKRAIDKKLENKVDSAVDKSDRDEAKAKQQTEQKQSEKTSAQENGGTKATGRGLFGGKIDIKYNDEYKFTGRIYMQMETYDKKDVMKSDYYTYYNSNTLNAGIEMLPVDVKEGNKTVPTVFLFDNDNRCFMMLLENGDSKTGIISTMPSDSAMAAQAKNQKGVNPDKATITKTGNSRVIAGYRCDEYKIVDADKDGYSSVWMTKDVKLKADKKYWGKAGMPTYYNYPGFEGAMMLAMESFDKNNKTTMKMETKEINDNFSHSISTVGITFMKMNFGQAGKK